MPTNNAWNNTILDADSTLNGGDVDIATDAVAHAVAIGNATGATSVTITSGTGSIALSSTSTGDITINSDDTLLLDADGVLELNSSGGAINIGNDADAQAINIGTGAAARTITIGNTTGATDLDLRCGTGDFTLASATGTIINALDTGEITTPLQPAFSAFVSAAIPNVTGDGTIYTIIFDTEVYDQNADYNTATGVFTAPVTGRYHFSATLGLDDLAVANFVNSFRSVTSNRNYNIGYYNVGAIFDPALGLIMLGGSFYADMDASDTAIMQTTVSGGTLIVDVHGGPSMLTYFGGTLVA